MKIWQAAVLIAAIGTARGAWLHLVSEPIGRSAETPQPIDARYAVVKGQLPARGTIGFRTNAPEGSGDRARRYTQALFALAPLVLVPDDGRQPVVLVDEGGLSVQRRPPP